MSKIINVKKAKMMYEKAQLQEFINDVKNKEIKKTVEEMIEEAASYGVNKANLAEILKVSKSTLTDWAANNSRKEVVYWCLVGIKHQYNLVKNVVKHNFEDNEDEYTN